ncbi:hypothetical protein GGE24_006923 [Bradyrhizobium centrosematis]|nr:hypothetical protein [Bradyrhizobium centrosematis]MCS3777548.1 hypothetical protein [Bradyrhizobium centrosematis]
MHRDIRRKGGAILKAQASYAARPRSMIHVQFRLRQENFTTQASDLANQFAPMKSRLPISTPLWRKIAWVVVAWK